MRRVCFNRTDFSRSLVFCCWNLVNGKANWKIYRFKDAWRRISGKVGTQRSLNNRVKLSENTETHELVAIKMFDKEKIKKQNLAEQIKLEISIMNKLKHPNMVNLIEVLGCKSKVVFLCRNPTLDLYGAGVCSQRRAF